MDLLRIAARVAADPAPVPEGGGGDMQQVKPGVRVDLEVFDGDYSPDDIVGSFNMDFGAPLWAAMHELGWVLVSADPATLTPETPVVGGPDAATWGDALAQMGSEAPAFKHYATPMDFLLEDDLLGWMCSHDPAQAPGVIAQLHERGWDAAADKLNALMLQ